MDGEGAADEKSSRACDCGFRVLYCEMGMHACIGKPEVVSI